MSDSVNNAGKDGVQPFVESDATETAMVYDEGSRVPRYVVLVWLCALVGFAMYMIRFAFPDLSLWGSF